MKKKVPRHQYARKTCEDCGTTMHRYRRVKENKIVCYFCSLKYITLMPNLTLLYQIKGGETMKKYVEGGCYCSVVNVDDIRNNKHVACGGTVAHLDFNTIQNVKGGRKKKNGVNNS